MTARLQAHKRGRGPAKGARRPSRMKTIGELVRTMRASGRWWLVPLVVILLVLTVALVGIKVAQYAAPFVYTLF